jgi:hypothetical protein
MVSTLLVPAEEISKPPAAFSSSASTSPWACEKKTWMERGPAAGVRRR